MDPGGYGVVASVFPISDVMKVAKRSEVRGCAITEDERAEILVDPEKERSRLAKKTELPPGWFSSERRWQEVDGGS